MFMVDKQPYLHNVVYLCIEGMSYEVYLDEVNLRFTFVYPSDDHNCIDVIPDKFYPCSLDFAGYASVEVN